MDSRGKDVWMQKRSVPRKTFEMRLPTYVWMTLVLSFLRIYILRSTPSCPEEEIYFGEQGLGGSYPIGPAAI